MTPDDKTADKIRELFPIVNARGGTEAELAYLARVSRADVETLSDDPEFVASLAAEVFAAEHDGRLLKPLATVALTKGLNVILSHIDAVDPMEAADLMKAAQRVLDAADRRDALAKDKWDGLKMINVIIGSNMSVSAEVLPTPAPKPLQVESAATDVQDVAPRPTETPTDAIAMLSVATPLRDLPGDESWA